MLGMGVFIGKSTKNRRRATGEVMYGEVPPYSVVSAGSMPSGSTMANGQPAPNLYCAVIVKRVDEKTAPRTGINETAPGLRWPGGAAAEHDVAVLQPSGRIGRLPLSPRLALLVRRRSVFLAQMMKNEVDDAALARSTLALIVSGVLSTVSIAMLAIKRLHDIGYPGRCALLFIPGSEPDRFQRSLPLAGAQTGQTVWQPQATRRRRLIPPCTFQTLTSM